MGRSINRVLAFMAIATSPLATALAYAGADRPPAAREQAAADTLTDTLSHRLFPLLSAVAQPDRLAALRARPALASMLAARAQRRDACGKGFKDIVGAACEARAMLWSETEEAALSEAIAALPGLDPVRPDDGLAAQLHREIGGLNAIVHVYGLGEASRYPTIDGPGIPVDGPEAQLRLRAALGIAEAPRAGSLQPLDRSVEFALALLDTHDRTDAVGFEPLAGGLNAAAMARAKGLDWSRYRYSAMIIPGSGPEVPEMPLSQVGKLHVRLAANRFARGDMPFIIVSGGRAHPRATRFTEAVEMRRALIERYGVPAEAILIEPYARHTTTNLRNAARLLIAMRAPLGRPTLIVANPDQSGYIEGPLFAERNRKELGYEPGRVGKRLAPTEIEFRPSSRSARIDPQDPLDP
jgi:hypothetical protein